MAAPRSPDGRSPVDAASCGPVRARQPLPAPGPPARRLRSADLLGSELQVEIEHGQAVYRLRQTALGKLILTK